MNQSKKSPDRNRYTEPITLADGTKTKVVIDPAFVEEAKSQLVSGDPNKIINAIISITLWGDKSYPGLYELALESCHKFHKHTYPGVRQAATYGLKYIHMRYGKIDMALVIEILKSNLLDSDLSVVEEAKDTLGYFFSELPKQRKAIRKNIERDMPLGSRYDIFFVPRRIIAEIHKKIRQHEKKLSFCCDKMKDSIRKRKIISYAMTIREYDLELPSGRATNIRFCPWCAKDLTVGLRKEYFDLVERATDGECPDIINFTNVPDEFRTDEWWRKRGL